MEPEKIYHIAVGKYRYSKEWAPKVPTWDQFCERVSKYVRTKETQAEYARMNKGDRDRAKDHGGFVGGDMEPGQRVKSAVRSRSMVTLDFDNCGSEDLPGKVEDALPDTAFVMYTTHSHTPENARWRVIVPLSREVSPEEYVPIARRVAERIGINMADPTTYQVERLMYWPSCSADAQPETHAIDGDPLDADEILGTYMDWHDAESWPHAPGEVPHVSRGSAEDPRTKDGPVGLFCRTYTIQQAIRRFIPEVYVADPHSDDRFTYAGGSSKNGFVVYENGLIGWSNHATDPVSGKAVNAFDLVRIHKFAHLDTSVSAGTPLSIYPSYRAMRKLIDEDKACQARLNKEQFEDLDPAETMPVAPTVEEAPEEYDWHNDLARSNGSIMAIVDNVKLIMENDVRLKDKVRRDIFRDKDTVFGDLPWIDEDKRPGSRWSDDDTTGLLGYLTNPKNRYAMKVSREMVANSVSSYLQIHSFHPVRDYLNGLQAWEGDPKSPNDTSHRWEGNVIDTVLVDYLGAPDTPYVRAVTRKHLVAAVARVMRPGCKYDTAWVLLGTQGLGKSQLLRALCPESDWLNESLVSLEGKDGSEALRGKWFVELPEMSAMKRSDIETAKAFISRQVDTYRGAYRRDATDYPRQCVINLTTNSVQMLKDDENRRFWVVDCSDPSAHLRSWDMTPEHRDLIWAQALWFYRHGESLVLPPALDMEARAIQKQHTELADDPRIGRIAEWILKPIPNGWMSMSKDERVKFVQFGTVPFGMVANTYRQRICPMEACLELFGMKWEDDGVRWTCREIAKLFAYIPGLVKEKGRRQYDTVYGKQQYWSIDISKTGRQRMSETFETHNDDGEEWF